MLNKKTTNQITLFIQYLSLSNNSFFRLVGRDPKTISFTFTNSLFYFIPLSVRLVTPFYKPTLVDLFSYEIPKNSKNLKGRMFSKYNIYSATNQVVFLCFFLSSYSTYLYIMFINYKTTSTTYFSGNYSNFKSIENLFLNSNWLEREASEMTGIFFANKLDTRNLLLMYGDLFFPILKFFTSFGIYELFYNVSSDVIYKSNISIQN